MKLTLGAAMVMEKKVYLVKYGLKNPKIIDL
jgi:hypothetical protein